MKNGDKIKFNKRANQYYGYALFEGFIIALDDKDLLENNLGYLCQKLEWSGSSQLVKFHPFV